jgi:hypothetical protein
VTDCCQLGRLAVQRLPEEDACVQRALRRWLCAFPVAVMCYVREEEGALQGLLQG